LRAAYIHGVKDVRIGEKDTLPNSGEEVLIRVSGVGVCGSDLHYYLEGGIGAAVIHEPFVPGHEFAGRVVEDRPDLGLHAGQLVAVDPAMHCGHCEWCERGYVNLCPNVVFLGAPPYDGAMTENIAVRPEQIFPLPNGFTVSQAVMLEPLGVAMHAIDLAKPQILENVAVLGCGPIGLCLVQLAKLAGAATVCAIDPVDYRADAARRLGADVSGPEHTLIEEWTDGCGTELVVEATNSPLGFQHAAEAAKIGGRVVLAGIPDGDQYGLGAALPRRKGLTVKFSRRMGHVYPRAIRLVSEGRVDVESIVTHRFALEESRKAFELQSECREGAVKSVIFPDGTEWPGT